MNAIIIIYENKRRRDNTEYSAISDNPTLMVNRQIVLRIDLASKYLKYTVDARLNRGQCDVGEKKAYKSKRKCEKCTDHLAEMRVDNRKRTSPKYVSIINKTDL